MNQDKAIDPKGASPEDLTKTTNKGGIELTEEELKKASGGFLGEKPGEFLQVKLEEVFITSVALKNK